MLRELRFQPGETLAQGLQAIGGWLFFHGLFDRRQALFDDFPLGVIARKRDGIGRFPVLFGFPGEFGNAPSTDKSQAGPARVSSAWRRLIGPRRKCEAGSGKAVSTATSRSSHRR